MSDLLKTGLAWLTGQMAASMSTSVRYARGPDSTLVRATFGRKLLKLADELGAVRIEWTDLDLIIPAADLVLAGESITPRRGDQVLVTGTDGTRVYEVFPYGNEPCWAFTDPHGTQMRIRTKFVSQEVNS